MQPGNVPPPPNTQPTPYNPMSVATVGLVEDPRLIEMEQAKQANRSKAAAFGVAALMHVLIGLLLAWIVMAVIEEDPPELVIESTGASDLPPTITKEEFSKKVSNDRPSPPSESSAVIVANVASPVSVPMIEDVTEEVFIGDATNGMGFGGGGFGTGTGASSTFFGTTGGGDNIVIVIDTSTSMPKLVGIDGTEAIKNEVNRTVSKLKPGTRFNIICFGNDADAISKKGLKVNSESTARVKEFMEAYYKNTYFIRTRTSKFGKAGEDNEGIKYHPIMPNDIESLKGTTGGSRMDLALVAAFEQKPATVFLIADGEPGTARQGKKLDQRDLIKLIEKEAIRAYGKGEKLPTVHAISVKDQGEKMLRAIAREFKGKYKSIDPAKE